jgi:hypothetical protein
VALGDDADRVAHAHRLGEDVDPGHARAAASGRDRVVRMRTVVDLPARWGRGAEDGARRDG